MFFRESIPNLLTTSLWRDTPVQSLLRISLVMMERCGTCRTMGWCIHARRSWGWSWMRLPDLGVTHWMISCYQGQIAVVLSLVYWFDFGRNASPLWPTCSACFIRSRYLWTRGIFCGFCGGLAVMLTRPSLSACSHFWSNQLSCCGKVCITQNSIGQCYKFQSPGSGNCPSLILCGWLSPICLQCGGGHWSFCWTAGLDAERWVPIDSVD